MGLYISINKSIALTSGEKAFLDELKKFYSNVEGEVVIYVQNILGTKRPDFIVIDSNNGVSIIEVKDWTEDYIGEVTKRKVMLVNGETENPNIQVKGYKNILLSGIFTRDFDIDEDDINTVVVYTNLSEEIKSNEKFRELFANNTKYIFKKDLDNIKSNMIFNEACTGFSKNQFNKIRVTIFPEVEIVQHINSNLPLNKHVDIKALDYEQEEFAKRLPIGHYMVTGIPGSGKTVILLSRAIHLIKENPNWNILILTYNKSLSYKLNKRLDKIAEVFKKDINNRDINIDNIKIVNFHKEVAALIPGIKRPSNIDSDAWFKTESIKLAKNNVKPIYDAILIDEYQDFYMNWISLVLDLCKSYKDKNEKVFKNIFLAGDRLQSIYNKNDVSWISVGIDMRGRSKLLKTSYRTGKNNLSLALEYLKQNKSLKDEVDKFYKDDNENNYLNGINNGDVEFINGNYRVIRDIIIDLKNKGYKNEDFLILVNGEKGYTKLIQEISLDIKSQIEYVKEINNISIDERIIVTTYQSSKGLEAKIVFLINPNEIYIKEDIENNLKKKIVYVGMTRASEKLFIYEDYYGKDAIVSELRKIHNEIKK